MTPTDLQDLQSRLAALEQENASLKESLSVSGREAHYALAQSQERYRFLFNSMDEGFCIIEFFDGPHGPLSDYIHIEANPAYEYHAGIPDVVGKKLREMVREEADGWVEFYGEVLRTGKPVRFERELVATGRYLALTAFRIEP
ncbi:sensory box sensor histidine kinase/response regulator, partial [Pseudomonas syringae pv. actinidiae ICMP 18804]